MIKEARHLMAEIQEDFFTERVKANSFIYAGKIKTTPITEDEFIWVKRNPTGGLLPMVALDANSPIGRQGNYTEFKGQAMHFREAIRFSRPELRNIVSNDKNIKIVARTHIKREVQDQMMRALITREVVAHSVIARASLRYSRMDSGLATQVNVTFPIKQRTVSSTWSAAGTTIVTDLNTFLDEYEIRVGSRPDFIRMSARLFNNNVKTNTEVRNIYTIAFQGQKRPADFRSGGYLTTVDVAEANGWPPIELFNERYHVDFIVKTAAAAGNNVEIPLEGGTFGLFVGDKALIGFGRDADGNTSFVEEQTITAINHGKSIVVGTLDAAVAVGATIAARPTFFPENRILLGKFESDKVEFLEPPYGIDIAGNEPVLPEWRGIRADAFMSGGEPNLTVFRRVWDAFGMIVPVDGYETIKVIL